ACSPCAAGAFSAEADAASCEPWTSCEPGSWVSAAGTATTDRECSACLGGLSSSGTNAPWCDVGVPFSSVSAGLSTKVVCALRSDDSTAVCWGGDNSGAASSTPAGVAFTQLSVGQQHVCGIRAQ